MQENMCLWRVLHTLGDPEFSSFSLERGLRLHSTSQLELYLLHRMSNRLSEPKKSLARSKLVKALRYRGLPVPLSSAPLVLGCLAHSSSKANLRQLVRGLLLEHTEACIPLHIPKAGIVEGRWATLEHLFHSVLVGQNS